jgi:hypothetical protein
MRCILCAGAGSFECAHITLTQGIHLGSGDAVAGQLVSRFAEVSDRTEEIVPACGSEQGLRELAKAGYQVNDLRR